MSTNVQDPPTTTIPTDPTRKTALIAGIFYLITFVSIPTLALYDAVCTTPDYITGIRLSDTAVVLGGFLEMIVAIAGIGTAVTLFPVVKRQNEGFALGFVTTRVLEASIIFIGVVSLLSIVTMRQDHGGSVGVDTAALVTTGETFAAFHNWTFLLGQAFMPGLNALLLGYLMYRSGLVPRIIPTLALIGGPPLLASSTATLFGVYPQLSGWSALATLPVFVWELSLGLWLTFKGFKSCPITESIPRTPSASSLA